MKDWTVVMERKSMCKCLPSYSPNIRMFPCKHGASLGNCSFIDLYYHSNLIRYYGHYFIHIRSSFFTKICSSKKSPIHTLLDFGNLSWWVLVTNTTLVLNHFFYLAGMICHLIALYIPRSVIYMEFAVDIWVRGQMMNSRLRKFRIGISEWDNLELATRT